MHIYYENIKVRFLKITMKKQLFDHITLCVNISSKMTFFCDHEKSNFFVIIMKNMKIRNKDDFKDVIQLISHLDFHKLFLFLSPLSLKKTKKGVLV